jgi:hypothetical protein
MSSNALANTNMEQEQFKTVLVWVTTNKYK